AGLSRIDVPSVIVCLIIAIGMTGCASFEPVPLEQLAYLDRAETQESDGLRVTVSVLTREESRQAFGKKLDKKLIQPVWIEIENNSGRDYWLMLHGLDPDYFSAREAANVSHGASRASNRGIDDYFDELSIDPAIRSGTTRSGFVFSNLKQGTKEVRVRLFGERELREFESFVTVPGLRADWQRVDFEALYAEQDWRDIEDAGELRRWLEDFMCCTTKKDGTGSGDPINLVVIAPPDSLKAFIKAGWDETEIITAGSSWRTFTSFITGSEYKYSPISALYVFQRSQDIGLQKARDTIHERNHLRLWLSPIRFRGDNVWIGAISRDIGVFFTTRAWNLTSHAIDPQVDEARDYLIEDLAIAESLGEVGLVGGVGTVTRDEPKENLLGSPWWTDGSRAVLWLSSGPVALEELEFIDWGPDFVDPERTRPE
ncbi:MAG: LssY C-terminal domain-containing protein, partial [Gammaproteobacteria bacterium]|nr:LssY C-terminal domain-containing protein [Gammaproteobacteria bacterium]